MKSSLRLTLISDTHLHHRRLKMPSSDWVIHCGDFSRLQATEQEIVEFLDWLAEAPSDSKILIAGNHDFWAERESVKLHELAEDRGIHYLENESVVIDGWRVWGSPYTLSWHDLAFNLPPGEEIDRNWQLIPADSDIVVTHGPPLGVLDRTVQGKNAGCQSLRKAIERVRPRLHVFGHIHEGFGVCRVRGLVTVFANACSSTNLIHEIRQPMTFVLDAKASNELGFAIDESRVVDPQMRE